MNCSEFFSFSSAQTHVAVNVFWPTEQQAT